MASQRSRALQFSGHQHFRQRLVLSLLSRKPVRIGEIRSHDEDPGLKGKRAAEPPRKTEKPGCQLTLRLKRL